MPNVAVVGGGPAGSTTAALLRKYDPSISVTVVERAAFPRDHVGESQLPPIAEILHEMGAWEKVEAAGFPVKIGATYRWGTTDELWDFDFLPAETFRDEPRPARYEGQRARTAFQVDRSKYDHVLLEHARSLGAEVRQPERVEAVERDGDRIEGLRLSDGSLLTADWYVDASGSAGLIRRAMGVEVDYPTSLRNIAIWSYWRNADWAVEIGVGGTRVQVMSLGYGWIWFIPLGPDRTSVGLIVPASYYKEQGLRPEDLYHRALAEEPRISGFLKNATKEPGVATTKDWSFVSERLTGENWFLAGECAGFADPILAAGMTLAHAQARETAYTILALRNSREDAAWLKETYDRTNRARIRQHIRFADFWYSANGRFTAVKEYCSEIARDAGLTLEAEAAFQWLGTGGFTHDRADYPSVGSFPLGTVRYLAQNLTTGEAPWACSQGSLFVADLEGAERTDLARYADGRIERVPAYVRDGKTLPFVGLYKAVLVALARSPRADRVMGELCRYYARRTDYPTPQEGAYHAVQALEAMILDGWVRATDDPSIPRLGVAVAEDGFLHRNRDRATVAAL